MELHPILECGENVSKGLWYVVSSGTSPESRVGQACIARTKETSGTDEVLAIGGANPSATFADVYRLDWGSLQWTQVESKGLRSRYEHTAFVPKSSPDLVYIYGGANKSGNLDCLQSYNRATNTWSLVSASGRNPGPRTIHCGAASDDKLFVWGGGHLGADPVSDRELHIFDAATKSWSQPSLQGDVPSPRHGHVMVVVGTTLYIHGGMAGMTFYDDLYAINLESFSCAKLTVNGNVPNARAAHSACSFQSQIYMFGGMCIDGALDDFFVFDTATAMWTLMKFDCPPPAPRLDHSLICTMLPVRKEAITASQDVPKERAAPGTSNGSHRETEVNGTSEPNIVPVDIWQGTVTGGANGLQNLSLKDCGDSVTEDAGTESSTVTTSASPNGDAESGQDFEYIPVCVVIGGMDTSGNLFNDVLVTAIGGKAE